MKIIVYGLNYSPELTGIGKYTGEMVEWMVHQGHDVRVITAPPYYPEWSVGEGYSAWKYYREKGEIPIWRCPLYIPKKLSMLRRILHLSSFALSSIFPLLAQRNWKPDLIIGVMPTLFCIPGIRILAKLTGARTLLHIQDYEVDAMIGLRFQGKRKTGLIARLASAFERSGLLGVDYVSTISHAMMRKAHEKGVSKEKVIFFPNWSELSRFRQVRMMDVEKIRRKLNFPLDKKIILYSGNIGEKQGMDIIIEAAARTTDLPWIFIIVGEGGGKSRIEKMVSDRKIKNVKFYPLQPYESLPALLKLADSHLVIQRRGAADAVLPSKLTNIFAVGGNAVVTAESHTELGLLCQRYPDIAVCVEPESVDALIQGISQTLLLPEHNAIAQAYAEKSFDKEQVLNKFISDIQG